MAAFKENAILDEIALEGLEGTTLSTLWVNLLNRFHIPVELNPEIREHVWQIILKHTHHLTFFQLPEPRLECDRYNRFKNLDPEWGVPLARSDESDRRKKYNPIQDGDIMGSCQFYKERIPIDAEALKEMTLDEITEKWGHTFVIVASQRMRCYSLVSNNEIAPTEFSQLDLYCLLEIIGRSRFNGECTSGTHSLLDFCKDATIVFYFKKRLKTLGLISVQTCNEIRKDRLALISLLTLVRFHFKFKSVPLQIVTQLHNLLKNTPDHKIELTELRTIFGTEESRKRFKKCRSTHLFNQLFETQSLPSSTKSKNEDKSKRQTGKRVFFTLRDPKASVHDIIKGEDKDKDDPKNIDFDDEMNVYSDMPMKEEHYRAIAKYGSRGCSQSEWTAILAETALNIRHWTKRMLALNLISAHRVDHGRQRTMRYVAIEHAAKADSDHSAIMATNNVTINEEPCMSGQLMGAVLTDVASITALVKTHEQPKFVHKEHNSDRYVTRKAIIINTINERDIVQVNELRSLISRAEHEKGLKEEVCTKSVRRLLSTLVQQNSIQLHEIQLEHAYCTRQYIYATHPKIGNDHEVIKREIFKLKHALLYIIADQQMRNGNRRTTEQTTTPTTTAIASTITSTANQTNTINSLSRSNQKPPKFLISRVIHKLIAYIILDLKIDTVGQPITSELIDNWHLEDPTLPINEHMGKTLISHDTPLVYTTKLGWQTFIPPLPLYNDIPHGWLHFNDVLDRLPLSLFNEIYRIDTDLNPIFKPFLSHPIQQHYLVRQLPEEIIATIHSAQVINTNMRILKVLNNMSLIQMGDRKSQYKPHTSWIYLNRKTMLLDTTSSKERYARVESDRQYPIKQFHFHSVEDVVEYWTYLQRICFFTKLGFNHSRALEEKTTTMRELPYLPVVEFVKAPLNDNGTIHGDKAGSAGLPTYLFAHAIRSWTWMNKKDKNKMDETTECPNTNHARQWRRKTRLTKLHVAKATTSYESQTKSSTTKKPSKSAPRDSIDEDALKNMSTLRVKWTKQEDTILKMGRAVYLYIAPPIPIMGMLTVGKVCRDIMRHNLGSINKTCQACVRRIHFLRKVSRDQPEVATWLYLLQTNDYIQKKFGNNLMERLKKANLNREDLIRLTSLLQILLMHALYNILNNTDINISTPSAVEQRDNFQMPKTIAEFWRIYKMNPMLASKSGEQIQQYENPKNENDLQVSVALNILHSSMCSSRDKHSYHMQAFEIYKHFSEDILQEAYAKARRDSLVVSIKRTNVHLTNSHMRGQRYVLSSKYRTRLTYLRLPYEIYEQLHSYVQNCVSSLFVDVGNLILKTPNLVHLCYIAENLTNNQLRVQIELPVNMLTIGSEPQSSNDLRIDRTFLHYQNILEYVPKTEYIENMSQLSDFALLSQEKQPRVRFRTANLSNNINYSPYDFLSKLNSRHLHFFCALNNLNREIELDFDRLHRSVDGVPEVICPFSHCVMKDANYIKTIDFIIKKHQTVLPKLTIDPTIQAKLLDRNNDVKTIVLQYNNFLHILEILTKFWFEKEAANDRKDLGKIATNATPLTIDMVQISRNILNCDNNEHKHNELRCDEYEANFTKDDDCVARAQDVFVISMSKLIFTPSESNSQKMSPCKDDYGKRRIDRILEKVLNESCWKYSDESWPIVKSQLIAQKLEFGKMQILEQVLNYIESQAYGVGIPELKVKFAYQEEVIWALTLLKQHKLIRRVGVALPVYVHKVNLHKWLVQTFHIKRLEQESLPTCSGNLKRRLAITTQNSKALVDETETNNKRAKLEIDESIRTSTIACADMAQATIASFGQTEHMELEPASRHTRDALVMRSQPWIRLNGTINRRVLDRWMGAILTECVALCGCTVQHLCQTFPHMFPVDVMFLLEILQDLRCIELNEMSQPPATLFSSYSIIKKSIITEISSPTETYITACLEALTRFSTFIGNKKYSSEFI